MESTPDNSITLHEWTHVAVTYDSSNPANDPIIYINGVAQVVTENQAPSGSYNSDAAFSGIIGNTASATDRTFDGTIDEVRLYDYTLTAAQINALIPVEITARETEDLNGDGQIDRIRITTSKALNDNYGDLNIDVVGYTVTGIDPGALGDNVFIR